MRRGEDMILNGKIQTEEKFGSINRNGLFTHNGDLISDEIAINSDLSHPVVIKDDGKIEVIKYIELIGKTDYTIRGSIAKVKDIVMKSDIGLGVTDTGVGYALYHLNQEALSQGKKSILGAEFSTGSSRYYILSKNLNGYHELIRLLTEYSANQQNLPEEKFPSTSDLIVIFDSKTPPNEFIMSKVLPEDAYFTRDINNTDSEKMYKLSDKYNKKLVLSTNYHRVNDEDTEALRAFRKIGGYDDESVLGKGSYFHTSKEMEDLGIPDEWMTPNIEIYNKVEMYDIKTGNVFYPEFIIPKAFSSEREYWEFLIDSGLKYRMGNNVPQEYWDRLDYEKDMIANMGYIGYFLIVADFINYAKRNFDVYDEETVRRWKSFINKNGYDSAPIAIGPARGSVAGSLVAYAMSIIDIDPLKYDLLFERFLNPDRVSLPDIDTDIPDNKRDEIIHYTKDYYNVSNELVESRVAGIGTFGTFKIKQLLKALVSTMYNKDTKYGEKLSNLVVDPEMSFDDYLNLETVQAEVADDLRFKKIAKIAPKLMNCIANLTQHAAGYVITPGAVTDFFPTVFVRDKDGNITEQLTAYTDVESLGILKMDYLGLRSMTIIDSTIREINKDFGTNYTTATILETAPTDINIFRHIASGNTEDVFQLASSGMTSVITRALGDINQSGANEKAKSGDYFSRIIAGIAMYRPGPMQFIDDFIRNALFPDKIEYPIEEMKDVLSGSYGLMIYQESIMALLQRVAGFSLAQADIARRAISKKKFEDLQKQKEIFIHGNNSEIPGGLDLGHDLDELEDLWSSVETFAAYGFNKSHAAGYAHIAITTAWLAYYYPAHFAVSNLNNPNDKDSIKQFIGIYKQRGIQTIPASINSSESDFTTDGESIRFGLSGIKMLASKADAIFKERQANGKFLNYYDFLSRMARNQSDKPLNKSSILGLIYSGALDEFYGSRLSKVNNVDKTTGLFSLLKKEDVLLFDKTSGDYFNEYLCLDKAEAEMSDILAREYEYTGFYISGHPTDQYVSMVEALDGYKPIGEMEEFEDVVTLGVITNVHKITTKRDNKIMAFITVEDVNSFTEAIVFPTTYSEFGRYLKEGEVVIVYGNVNEEGRLIVSSIQDANEHYLQFNIDSVHIHMPDDINVAQSLLDDIINNETVNQLEATPLFYYVNGKKYSRSNKYHDKNGNLVDIKVYLNQDILEHIYRAVGPENFQIIYRVK